MTTAAEPAAHTQDFPYQYELALCFALARNNFTRIMLKILPSHHCNS